MNVANQTQQTIEKTPQTGSHAVVIGSSIAGLTAAKTLVNHFAQVTLIERDAPVFELDFRSGVP